MCLDLRYFWWILVAIFLLKFNVLLAWQECLDTGVSDRCIGILLACYFVVPSSLAVGVNGRLSARLYWAIQSILALAAIYVLNMLVALWLVLEYSID
jgi:hypothetical protein